MRGKCAKFNIWGWAGGMAGKIWKLGHAEKNNWHMGTLSRMIAGHKGKGGTRGRKIMEFCLLVSHGGQASRQGRKGFVIVVGN